MIVPASHVAHSSSGNFYGSEIRYGFFGGLNFGPGIFWVLIFTPIRSSLSLEMWSTALGLYQGSTVFTRIFILSYYRPLHIAIAHGNTQLIEYLISLMSCLSLDIYNNLKQTPLHLAVITGQAYIVGKLITAGANPNMPDRNGQTPAHLACQRSSLTCLEELFKGQDGMDPDLKNFSGFTPLHEAVFASCTETVKCLVKHGANVNSKVCKDLFCF